MATAKNDSAESGTDTRPDDSAIAKAGNTLDTLLASRSWNEAKLQQILIEALSILGVDAEPQFTLSSGACDIYLPARRLIIEVKASGRADPKKSGSRPDETQYEQCARYVRDDWESEIASLNFDGGLAADLPWCAILTDGKNWWAWEWTGKNLERSDLIETQSFKSGDGEMLATWLSRQTHRHIGKPWVPNDIVSIYRGFEDSLREIFLSTKGSRGRETKQHLWLSMLRGSGAEPKKVDIDTLFIQHTLLVTISRAVIASLGADDRDPTDIMSEGFAGWPQARTSDGTITNIDGAKWTTDLFTQTSSYDWRQRGRDVLRALYQDLIPKRHRKEYGEYYTPDWLAAAVVDEVLDDAWIQRSVSIVLKDANVVGVGVLDPACGSGTFLYHAARRILHSKPLADQRLDPLRQANVVAALLYGIDIHPVAVEMARATVLRALPSLPTDGHTALRIYQGDSLLSSKDVPAPDEEVTEQMSVKSVDNILVASAPRYTAFRFPIDFIKERSFAENLERLVEAATNNEPMPVLLDSSLSKADFDRVLGMYAHLTTVIEVHGNSVWSWYIRNMTGPLAVRERRVDRIVANPPWVVMKNIQNRQRKEDMEALAQELGTWGQGTTNTSYDIAALFVDRCSSLYLAEGQLVRSGWVLPGACRKGKNWRNTRQKLQQGTVSVWDLRFIRDPPFPSSASAVWIREWDPVQPKRRRDTGMAPASYRYENRIDKDKKIVKIAATDSWATVGESLEVSRVPPRVIAPSYYRAGSGFSQGATLVPHCLIKVLNSTAAQDGTVQIEADRSKQYPWNRISQQGGIVPGDWLHEVITSTGLLTFTVDRPLPVMILPIDSKGDFDSSCDSNEYWQTARQLYAANKGLGADTPQTLDERLNYYGALLKQTQRPSSQGNLLIYNTSGQYVRAARSRPTTPVDSGIYWKSCASAGEAKYLAAVLNADCLQAVYQEARNSDRHFHKAVWDEVPIGRFDPRNQLHMELVALCGNAEKVAKQQLDKFPPKSDQTKRSNMIRSALRDDGVAGEIDAVLRRLLPDYVTE